MNENECIECGEKEPTTQEPIRKHVCNSCSKADAQLQRAEFELELEEAML